MTTLGDHINNLVQTCDPLLESLDHMGSHESTRQSHDYTEVSPEIGGGLSWERQ